MHQRIEIPKEKVALKAYMPLIDLGLICQKEVIEDVVGFLFNFNTFIIIICKSF